jgi:hypothetical protein
VIVMSSMQTTTFDERLARIEAGETLSRDEILQLSRDPDILHVGMLADAMRRRLRGTRVTYLRTAYVSSSEPAPSVLEAARELVLTGSPDTAEAAIETIRQGRRLADAGTGPRTLAAFSWRDVERLSAAGESVAALLRAWREAGLDALAEFPLDAVAEPLRAVEQLQAAGFSQLRLSVEEPDPADALSLWLTASDVQQRTGVIHALNPLPSVLRAFRPTTGYADVKMVALARLAAPGIPVIQVDWRRYGPKLAQVALTFGADDVVGISPSDDAQEGRRRTPLEEIRRNVEAAGFQPSERDGRFALI